MQMCSIYWWYSLLLFLATRKLANLGDAMPGFVSDIYDVLFLFVIASEFVSFSYLKDIQSLFQGLSGCVQQFGIFIVR